MKRIMGLISALHLLLSCTACRAGMESLRTEETPSGETDAEEITEEQAQAEQKSVWGITLTVKNVTPTGLTLICTQSGGEPTGELETGSYYTVQRLMNGEWLKAEYTEIDEEQVGWTGEGWLIPKEDTVEWEVDWSWLYDELPAGQYRIGKEIVDFRETGDFDTAILYAEFTIE